LLDKKFLHRDIDGVIYLPKHFVHACNEFREKNNFIINVNFEHEKDKSQSEEETRSNTATNSE